MDRQSLQNLSTSYIKTRVALHGNVSSWNHCISRRQPGNEMHWFMCLLCRYFLSLWWIDLCVYFTLVLLRTAFWHTLQTNIPLFFKLVEETWRIWQKLLGLLMLTAMMKLISSMNVYYNNLCHFRIIWHVGSFCSCGCPSPKVSGRGCFGAHHMLNPKFVGEAMSVIAANTDVAVTVKCRIGVDDHDSYSELCKFFLTRIS